MTELTLEQKQAQYDEFFAIDHNFSVNITPIDTVEDISFEDFISNIPKPFMLATEVNSIDQSALRSLQNQGNTAAQLVSFLNQQSQKIDLLIGYILSLQDEAQYRYQGTMFGGGGIMFTSSNAFSIGQHLELKIFIPDNNCAVYCYGEVIELVKVTEGEDIINAYKVHFHFIREEDRESLVRASLHEQAKQLQKLAQLRKKES